jgi:hypothetical protein
MIFTEVQRFNRWWHWIIIGFVFVGFIGSISALFSMPAATIPAGIIGTIGLGLTALLFLSIRLTTRIDKDGIHYRYLPFHFRERHIEWEKIENIGIKTYNSFNEYGGWGLRFRFFDFNDVLLNVAGNKGIRIILKSGSKRMIGTFQPEEAQTVIDQFWKNQSTATN